MKKAYMRWTGWISVVVTTLLFFMLVFCTLFGDELYTWITPEIPVQRAKTTMRMDGEKYICIPKSAVTEKNTIYVVTSERGFSRIIYRIHEIAIEYIHTENSTSEVLIITRIPQGSFIVTEPWRAEKLQDDDKVLIGKGNGFRL